MLSWIRHPGRPAVYESRDGRWRIVPAQDSKWWDLLDGRGVKEVRDSLPYPSVAEAKAEAERRSGPKPEER